MNLSYVSLPEIKRIRQISDPYKFAAVFADVLRINELYMIRKAGSGHPGTSFSCTDIITWLFTQEMQNPNEKDANLSDIYFSSKGHDAPALYALLIALEKLDFDLLHKLRVLGGLPGHPHVETPHMVTNTGSLGMGISKAHGMVLANKVLGKSGHIYVLTGDGELQEGQIWESLQPVANAKISEITVIVDHNKIQSDIHVKDTSDLAKLEDKFRAFGWEVARANGHDFKALKGVFTRFKTIKDRPQILIADTLKGKGVSFMERLGDDGLYKFHSGAPSFEQYEAGLSELVGRVNARLSEIGQEPLKLETVDFAPRPASQNPLKLIAAYGDELVKIAHERKDVVGMDADLVLDTGLIPFKKEFPDRYVECGIAEQDMVSIAGGLALQGALPIVHSFACFLSTRPNEHIYNNASEGTKIIYTASLAGLLPATPGHSHQSVRDISCLGAMPGLSMIQPATEEEIRQALRWAVEKNQKSTYIRICNVPAEISYRLPENYKLEYGKGVSVKEGKDVVIISYGPVMLEQSFKAAKILEEKNISTAVINMPWLNVVDDSWLKEAVTPFKTVVTVDDHYVHQGMGEFIAARILQLGLAPKILTLGVETLPECGQNTEVLKHHKLDAESVANRISEVV